MRRSFNLTLKGINAVHLDMKQGKVYIQTHISVALSAFVYRKILSEQTPGLRKAGVVSYAPQVLSNRCELKT